VKLGWIVAPTSEAMEKLEWIADTYLSVGAPVQCAAERLLAAGESVQRQIRQRTAANLAHTREALTGSPANLLAVEGGWYATLQVPRVRSEEEWALELLDRHNVLVQPGFFFDFAAEAFLVVSLLTTAEVFREGLARILDLLSA
jgi:aspartate/methionine/tyrosine aminotransferase